MDVQLSIYATLYSYKGLKGKPDHVERVESIVVLVVASSNILYLTCKRRVRANIYKSPFVTECENSFRTDLLSRVLHCTHLIHVADII